MFQGKDHFGIGRIFSIRSRMALEVPAGPVSPGGRPKLEAFRRRKGSPHRIDDMTMFF